MQSLIDKYEKILQKPHGEPYQGYLTELVEALKGKADKPRASKKIDGMKPDFKGEFYTPEKTWREVDVKMPYVETKGKVSAIVTSATNGPTPD